jgi:DNA topoisomerase III
MQKRCYVVDNSTVARHVAEYLGIAKHLNGAYSLKNGDTVTHLSRVPRGGVQVDVWRTISGPLRVLFDRTPTPPDSKEEQRKLTCRLLREAEIIVNACSVSDIDQYLADKLIADAGFDPAGRRSIGGQSKPVERVVLRGLDKASLRIALALSARRYNDDAVFVGLRSVGECRHEAEGLVNGEVEMQALALVVKRELEIRNFKPVTYYLPKVELPDGVVLTWKRRIEGADCRGIDEEGRIIDRRLAEAIVARIAQGLEGIVTDYQENTCEQGPPLPYNLPKLQTEMSARYGMSAKKTHDTARSLYEKRKMVTYIGTDCRYLPQSMHAEAPEKLAAIAGMYTKLTNGANPKIQYACWEDSKVKAYHAIIPTGHAEPGLSHDERNVFDAIARRYMAQFYLKHQYLQSKLEGQYGDDVFCSSWKKTLVDGWKEVDYQVVDANSSRLAL